MLPEPYEALMPLAPWEPAVVVGEAIASLCRQSHLPSTLVVSCDGAIPSSLRRVFEGSGLPLRVVEGPGGEGVGPVLARGLRLCQRELVLRADADDISLPERARRQVETMMACPQVAALSSPILEFLEDPSLPCGRRAVPTTSAGIRALSYWRNPLNHPAVMLRRPAVLAVGNYRACSGFEDYDLWLRILRQYGDGSLANLAEALVMARVGLAHLSRRHGTAYAERELRFFLQAAGEGLLPWHQVCLLIMIRVPLRFLPRGHLHRLMEIATRRRN
jgi:hypothetical protein